MLDLGFILCLAVAFFIGYKTGFLRALVGFMSVIVSAVGGYLLYPYVSSFLVKTPLYQPINQWVLNGLEGYLQKSETLSRMDALLKTYQAENAQMLITNMASGITTVIFNILSIFVIIILIKLIVLLLKKVTNIIHHIPVLGPINRLCGMALTGASFVTVCFIVVAVMLIPPSNTSEISKNLCRRIDESLVVKEVMDYNFFVNYESLKQDLEGA